MNLVVLGLTVLVVLCTMLPLIRTGRWWIRALDFFRLQIATLALLTCGLVLFVIDENFLRLWLLVVLVGCLIFHGYRLYPYTLLSAHQVLPATKADPAYQMSLLVANIQMDNHQSDRFIATVRAANPDVICLLETDEWWIHHLHELTDAYPYTVQQPQDNFYGMAVYSYSLNQNCRGIAFGSPG
jgi:endonuclease/exonuclease/phosphatase (EEP) superfamily protein YafD